MTTILVTFIFAVCIGVLLTPFARWFGIKFGGIDIPNDRKIHTKPTPRTGGLAIFITFMVVLVASRFWKTEISQQFILDQKTSFFLCGALVVFGIGLFDDFHSVPPKIKLLFQVAGASLAFWGGLRIGVTGFFGGSPISLPLSYFLTIFWFTLIINSINLVDGLDGLAGGIVFFSCVVIIILEIMRGKFLSAMLFSALGGATLGFLRYNFNPASIFLGDGGSYFLGYSIAGLSIMSSAKVQMGAILVIPMLALGVPLFDTMLAPVRRFIRGQRMFSPDNGHIHHKLIGKGLSSKNVVWVLYGVTGLLCLFAVIVTNFRDERAGLFLIVLGIGGFFFVRKLGYFEYFASDKIYGWLRDITDVSGLSRERRSFLSVQMDLSTSKDLEVLWENATRAFEMLKFDIVEMEIGVESSRTLSPFLTKLPGEQEKAESNVTHAWVRNGFDGQKVIFEKCLMKVELPLIKDNGEIIGMLCLMKDLKRDTVTHYTLRRIEHLRRTLVATLQKIENKTGRS